MLTHISTKDITDLKELIHAGAKLICEKIGIPHKTTNRYSKPGWDIRQETQIRNLRRPGKIIKQGENAGTWDKKKKQQKLK